MYKTEVIRNMYYINIIVMTYKMYHVIYDIIHINENLTARQHILSDAYNSANQKFQFLIPE